MSRPQRRPVIAIDLGGTKIAVALVSPEMELLARENSPTQAEEGFEAVLGRVFSGIDRLLTTSGMKADQLSDIAIAAPGPINRREGVLTLSPNIPGGRDVPLKSIISSRYGVEAFVINDARAATLAEHRLGAGRGSRHMVFMTVSTGIGGGSIIDGKLYTGAAGGAGEIGHMTIDTDGPKCSCGNTGCLEMLASGTAVAREARRRIEQGDTSLLTSMVKGKLSDISAETVAEAEQQGDALARTVLDQAIAYLGVGMVNLVNIFNPELIVVGGGMARMGERLLAPVRKAVNERAFRLSSQSVQIVLTKLGDDAGLLGAALFAFE